MLTPRQNPFSPTVSDSPAWNVDTRPCCPQWEARGTLPHNTAVWVGSITEDIFRWRYSTCKHLKHGAVYCVTAKASTIQSAGFCLVKKNPACCKFLKLAMPVEFLVSLLCRLRPVCKTRTINNQESILARRRRWGLHTAPTIHNTEWNSNWPAECLPFKTSSLSGQNH